VRGLVSSHANVEKNNFGFTQSQVDVQRKEFYNQTAKLLKLDTNSDFETLKKNVFLGLLNNKLVLHESVYHEAALNRVHLSLALSKVLSDTNMSPAEFTFPHLDVPTEVRVRVLEYDAPFVGRLRSSHETGVGIGTVMGMTYNGVVLLNRPAIAESESPTLTKRYVLANELAHGLTAIPIHRMDTSLKRGTEYAKLRTGKLVTLGMVDEAYSDWASLANTEAPAARDAIVTAYSDKSPYNYELTAEILRDTTESFLRERILPVPHDSTSAVTILNSLSQEQSQALHSRLLVEYEKRIAPFGPLLLQK